MSRKTRRAQRETQSATKTEILQPPIVPVGPQQLIRFSVKGLFGRYDLNLVITDNRLILVGENGAGKSTVVNILFYCLTGQWNRLIEMPFTSLEAEFSNEKLSIFRNSLRDELGRGRSNFGYFQMLRHRFGPMAEVAIRSLNEKDASYWTSHSAELFELSNMSGIDPWLLHDLVSHKARNIRSKYIESLETTLKRVANGQVLFLPTYRRIERDLQAIFPDARAERDLRAFHRSTPSNAAYVELVEFGMHDVEEAIKGEMQRLEREFRQDLVHLISAYLGEVIRGQYVNEPIDELLSGKTADVLPALLTRVDDKILAGHDREALKALIGIIQRDGTVPADRRVAAHFLVRLAENHARQAQRETNVRKFTDVCNSYLTDKQLVFDPSQFELHIYRRNDEGVTLIDQKIPVDGLSSGEKQIVSLFAHMYLTGGTRYFLIIDEPELSISVPWQRKFLEDIIGTEMCVGIVAVTHSPFIFENSLVQYAHSMTKFATPH